MLCDILFELEQGDEASHGEDLAQVVVQAADVNMAAVCLGTLQDAEEDTQTAGGNVLHLGAVKDDVVPSTVDEGLHILLNLWGRGGVETTFEIHYILVVLFFECCFHNDNFY